MDDKDRKQIMSNIKYLVNLTNENILFELLENLHDRGIMSEMMVSRYKTSQDVHTRVREFYLELQRRGPDAFSVFIDILENRGLWDHLKLLKPDHELNNQTFISLKTKNEKKEQKTNVLQNSSPQQDTSWIKVVKSTCFNNNVNKSSIQCYRTKSKNRGIVFMINIINFDNALESMRSGADADEKNLRELFGQIGFHDFILHKDLSKQEAEDELKAFAKLPRLKHTDCVFFIISSHGTSMGDQTLIKFKDGLSIYTEKIVDYFNSENCKYLRKIPKIFIFQACRGDVSDVGCPSDTENNIPRDKINSFNTQYDGSPISPILRLVCDTLIINSTLPGFASHRDPSKGSWYFISLCQVFMKHCHNTHLDDLFKMVDQHLQDIDLSETKKQTSSIDSRGFNLHCYLNPGLFEETN